MQESKAIYHGLIEAIKSFAIFLAFVFANFLVTIILAPILMDGFLSVQQALLISTPILIAIFVYYIKTFIGYYSGTSKAIAIDLIKFFILIFEFFHLLFNMYMCVDLFSIF